MDSKINFVEVGRTAHEIANRHGLNASEYAARMAAEALAEGKTDVADFWKAVALFLKPRAES